MRKSGSCFRKSELIIFGRRAVARCGTVRRDASSMRLSHSRLKNRVPDSMKQSGLTLLPMLPMKDEGIGAILQVERAAEWLTGLRTPGS